MEVFKNKIINGIYNPVSVHYFDIIELWDDSVRTRGNKYKLIQHHCHYDFKKFNFTNWVIPIWNSLPNRVVSAETVNNFKFRFDKFWSDQDVLYDYNADLHGIENRSFIYCSIMSITSSFQWYFSDTDASEAGRRPLPRCDVMWWYCRSVTEILAHHLTGFVYMRHYIFPGGCWLVSRDKYLKYQNYKQAVRLCLNIAISTNVGNFVFVFLHDRSLVIVHIRVVVQLGIAIPGSRDPGPFFNPEIPGVWETKSRDFGIIK